MSELVQLLKEKRPMFVRLAARYAAPAVDPEDCVQEASLLAFSAIGKFEGRAKLSTWFGTIVRNCALTSRRRARREANDISLETPICEELGVADTVPDDAIPADRLIDQQRVMKMIKCLGRGERAVLECTYVDGLTLRETSERLKMNIGTVKCYRIRGPHRLRKRLKLQ